MNTKEPFFNNVQYDWAKKLVQLYLPAISSLYFGLASIWGLPGAEKVVGTLAVIATFLGVLLGINSKRYDPYVGDFEYEVDEDGLLIFGLSVAKDPEQFLNRKELMFKVSPSNKTE